MWLRKLGIQRYHCSGSGHCCGTGLILEPGTFACHGHSPPPPKQKKKNPRYIFVLLTQAFKIFAHPSAQPVAINSLLIK